MEKYMLDKYFQGSARNLHDIKNSDV